MRIKNRLSSYPVLDNFGDDYINSSYTVDYDVYTQFTEIYGLLKFELKNKEIEQLIADKKAKYMVHIECPSTCYRQVYSSFEPEIEFKIQSSLLADTIEMRTFIVLEENINDYYSESFHPDYEGITFNLEAHQIIAIGTAQNYDVQKDDKDLNSLPSIIRIVKLEDKNKGSLSVNTDNNDHIIIAISGDLYDLYGRLGKSLYKDTIFSIVLLPSLIIVLQRMVNAYNQQDESMMSMHWFKVIENLLNTNKYDLSDLSIDNDSLFSVCQSIFADPVFRAFKELETLSERVE